MEIHLAYDKGGRHFCTVQLLEILIYLGSPSRLPPYPFGCVIKHKTAFTLPFGKYEHIKVPFGLAQALAYFQELMTGVLKDFPFAIACLDDIIICSRTAEEHLDHIKQVLKKLWNAQLSMKLGNVSSLQKISSTLDTYSASWALDQYHQNPCHQQHTPT